MKNPDVKYAIGMVYVGIFLCLKGKRERLFGAGAGVHDERGEEKAFGYGIYISKMGK